MKTLSIIGRIGQDPQFKSEKYDLAKFTVACNEKQNGKEETTWVRVTVFGKLATVVRDYAHKGDKIFCSGNCNLYTFKDLVASTIELLSEKKAAEDDVPF